MENNSFSHESGKRRSMANLPEETPHYITHIREAEAADSIKIQFLARHSWEENYTKMLSKEQIDYMLDQMYNSQTLNGQFANKNYHYYLLHIRDNETWEPVGFIGFENQFLENTTKLHRLYFLKTFTGKSLGKLLMKKMFEQVSAFGDERIILQVNKTNPAVHFYQQLGFEVYEEAIFDIGQGFVMDDYLMEYKM